MYLLHQRLDLIFILCRIDVDRVAKCFDSVWVVEQLRLGNSYRCWHITLVTTLLTAYSLTRSFFLPLLTIGKDWKQLVRFLRSLNPSFAWKWGKRLDLSFRLLDCRLRLFKSTPLTFRWLLRYLIKVSSCKSWVDRSLSLGHESLMIWDWVLQLAVRLWLWERNALGREVDLFISLNGCKRSIRFSLIPLTLKHVFLDQCRLMLVSFLLNCTHHLKVLNLDHKAWVWSRNWALASNEGDCFLAWVTFKFD